MRTANHFLGRACLSFAAAAIALTASLFGEVEREQGRFEIGVASASASERGFRVGDMLQALEDVQLDEATIATGSKVSVRAQKKVGGRVLLDLALADGHIVRAIPLTALRGSFRRVDG